ncbi:glycosyltransferase family 9 protein [Sphingomonas sp. PB4P5]|uniref:glycosyltransferase family 9 protein n=1 Tax=Parasphingomonas puruogangriensis TaxID=3096155 RepID=UPI002FC75BB7
MFRRLKRAFYILFIPRAVRQRRMKRRAFAAVLSTASTPVSGNVALPVKVLNEKISINTILILKLDHLGDFFTSIEAMCRLRAAWPHAGITLVCDPMCHNIAKALNIFDRIETYRFFSEKFERETGKRMSDEHRCSAIATLNLGAYDLAIDLRHDFDTRPCLSYVSAQFRVGYAKAGRRPAHAPTLDLALAEIPPEGPEQLHAETRINMLVALVIDTFLPPPARQISRLLDQSVDKGWDGRDYIVVAPCARSGNRTWPIDNFVALAKRIVAERDFGIVVLGSDAERSHVAGFCRSFRDEDCVNRAGAPLEDVPNIVAGASLFVGNDTGTTHLAALLGVPTLCLYGGVSDPRVWQPIGNRVRIVHSKTPCSYCHINVKEDCPYDQRCMHEIDVQRAFDHALGLLQPHALL